MKEKNEIQDIPDVPDEIISAAQHGRLVLFIGAGLSRIIGCPSWDEFACLFLKVLYEKKIINYHEYEKLQHLDARKLLSICRKLYEKKLGKKSLDFIKSFLTAKDDLNEKFNIYDNLYSFNAIYVTTNYDDYLDKVAQRSIKNTTYINSSNSIENPIEKDSSKNNIIYKKEELLISNLINGYVIHLHGSILDESNLILTVTDYIKHYKPDSKSVILLEEIFKNYTVLFVGYGLEEFEILELLVSKSNPSKQEVKHFMLYPIFKNEINLLKFYEEYYKELGIQLVPYPIDENGYEHLAEVISTWAKIIGPQSRPQDFLEKIKLIDEVLK
ncbi:SIR2 family protein [Rosettibacter firmus]|uniref:SIR2 family protein n=1 Tax=Rosettibacter firmus TaxID=3111522 RepID=UPI00336C1927